MYHNTKVWFWLSISNVIVLWWHCMVWQTTSGIYVADLCWSFFDFQPCYYVQVMLWLLVPLSGWYGNLIFFYCVFWFVFSVIFKSKIFVLRKFTYKHNKQILVVKWAVWENIYTKVLLILEVNQLYQQYYDNLLSFFILGCWLLKKNKKNMSPWTFSQISDIS